MVMIKLHSFTLLIFLFLFSSTTSILGEIIYLKNGERLNGKITQYSENTIAVRLSDTNQVQQIPVEQINLITFETKMFPREIVVDDANASLIYLKNGEIVKGQITQYTTEFLTLESISGHGVLQIPTSEINMISSATSTIKMNQRKGIGYHQSKSTLGTSDGSNTYNFDKLIYKVYLDENTFGSGVFAFANSTTNGKTLKVMAADVRYGKIFKRVQNNLIYYGGSVGLLQVEDDANSVNGSGITLEGFLGVEMFFPSLPNFGFTAELGLSRKDIGSDYSSLDFSTSTFPAFSVTYYY